MIPAAVAALREHVEQQMPATAAPSGRAGRAGGGPGGGEHPAAGAHLARTGRGRVHQIGPALLTVTLDAAHAQALAALLTAHRDFPRQTPAVEDDGRWGAGPAETAAAQLAADLTAYGPGRTRGSSRPGR
ncbi:hypothetical protein [Streptomyces sp. P9-A4]|uniref:hypothetical protein n=1 Tax=Streptomyces sp. P9-A4 TaxID=3072285 RepID=UPI002FCC9F71